MRSNCCVPRRMPPMPCGCVPAATPICWRWRSWLSSTSWASRTGRPSASYATCSTGSPGAYETPASYSAGRVVELVIAARSDNELRGVLATWSAAHPASAALDVELLLPGGAEPGS